MKKNSKESAMYMNILTVHGLLIKGCHLSNCKIYLHKAEQNEK